MTTNEIINVNCRKEEGRKIIQRALRKIKPLSSYQDDEDIPVEMIEKLIWKLSLKYNMRVASIMPDLWASDKSIIWTARVINEENLSDYGRSIYGASMYEVLSKAALFMYSKRNERRDAK